LQDDLIDPFHVQYDEIEFNNLELVNSIKSEYKSCILLKKAENSAGNIVFAFKAHDVAVIISGKILKVLSHSGEIDDDKIELLSNKWWEYWKNYWKFRETKDQYKKDYVCEVTIPLKE
jgi:hypothetical protein